MEKIGCVSILIKLEVNRMNKIFKRMLNAIKTGTGNELLKFGVFKIIDTLGSGEQGIVVLAQSPNEKLFAIKFYSPIDDKIKKKVKKGEQRFKREVEILIKLKHHNITNVYMAGSAKWIDSDHKWVISYNPTDPGKTLFYIMDFIKGKSVKSLFYKSRIKNEDKIDIKKCTYNNLNLFEQLILQISSCMTFFHNKKIAHRDIKPNNIIYSTHDNTFIIVDFGFAKYSPTGTSESSEDSMHKKSRFDVDSIRLGKNDYLSDQCIFSEMLLEILELFKPLYVEYNYNGIKSSLEKGMLPRNERYKNMDEFKNAIEPYLFSYPYHSHNFRMNSFLIPVTYFGHFNEEIKIPFSGSVPIFKEIKYIIDTGDFQRLKGIKQLGYTNFVYPGATHTRFEHSLGVYYLSLRYLEILLKNPKFCKAVEPVNKSIKLVVLASLLHDIGHYPFAHWVEEMEGLPDNLNFGRHEELAKNIITKGKIGKIIKEKWKIDPDEVCKLISGGVVSDREKLLRTIIHALIDVDKVDYLQRDSAHCGVPYGTAFDIERLINSLYINEEGNAICLTEKGRSPFLAFLMSSILMYQEVYWHKTVRVCTAMFKRVFFECLSLEKNNIDKLKQEFLSCNDDKFIEQLYIKTKEYKNINKLILPLMNRGRLLYKPAYVYYHEHELYTKNESTIGFFDILSKCSYPDQIKITICLVRELNKCLKNKKLKSTDIILETTPIKSREKPELIGFKFFDSQLGKYSILTSEVQDLNVYLAKNRRSYIFCHPTYYKQIKEITRSEKLDNILGKVVEKITSKEKI